MRGALVGLLVVGLAQAAEPAREDERIEFAVGSAQVEARWGQVLRATARALKQNELRGHAERREPVRLAHARAEAVKARLIALGAPRKRVWVVDGEPGDLRDLRPPRYVKLHVVASRRALTN
jgi:hypothetical protein